MMVMVLSRRRFPSCARPSRSGRCAIAQIRRGLRLLSPVPPCGTEACAVSPVPSSGHFPETIIFATTQLPNRVLKVCTKAVVGTLFADPKAPGASASAHCGTGASGRPGPTRPRRPYADGNSGALWHTGGPPSPLTVRLAKLLSSMVMDLGRVNPRRRPACRYYCACRYSARQ
jgi:hypothetical protein